MNTCQRCKGWSVGSLCDKCVAELTAERDALRDEMAARVGSLVAAVKDESWNVRIAERERDALRARVDELMGLLVIASTRKGRREH